MFHYFIEVSLAWTLLLIVYYVFLRKETFFKSNRLYLMYSLSLGMVLPLVRQLPFSFESNVASSAPVEFINAGTYHFSNIVDNPQQLGFTWDYQTLLMTIYALGLVFFSFRMFYGLFKILRIYNDSEKIKNGDYTLVVMDIDQLPFSFFKNVFISKTFLEKEYIQKVLEHELVHIKHKHTYDVFTVQILSIIFWWNPLIYIFKKALKETHEYLADAYACLDSDIKNYGLILLGQSSSGIELALTNQFFNSLLKKRINMLNRKKSAGYKMSKYLLAIPLLCFMVILFSASSLHKNEQPQEHIHPVIKTLENDKKLKKKLKKEFAEIYKNAQVKGKVREESKLFLKLLRKYEAMYSKHSTLREDFTSIACSHGIKLKMFAKGNGVEEFSTFMYIVPKHNYKAWKNGDMPEYDEMVCGPNSVQPPPAPPVPGFAMDYESPNSPLLIIDGKIIDPPYKGKVDYRVRHDFTNMTAEAATKKYGKKGNNGAHIINYTYPTFGINDNPNGIIYLGEKNHFSIKRYGGLEGDLSVKVGDADFNTRSKNDEFIFSIDMMPKGGKIDLEYTVGGEVIKRNYLVVEREIIKDEALPVIGMESPKDDVLYIGHVNKVVLKTFNVVVGEMTPTIACGNKYYQIDKVIVNEDPSEFIVEIDALRKTPKNQPCKVTFRFDDGNEISKSFHVREYGEVKEVELEEVREQPILVKGKVNQGNILFLLNGKETSFNKDDVIELDGHMIHYTGKEATDKFGEKGKDGVVDMIGKVTSIKNVKVNDATFTLDIDNKPVLENINASEFDNDNLVTIPAVKNTLDKNPLIIIDGEISDNKTLEVLKPDDIATIDVLKGDNAKAKYGEKAKNGVIEVVTINNSIIDDSYIVTGKVIAADSGSPLIGANVIVEGTKKGTITDLNGNYTIELSKGKHSLLVSYMGYKSLDSGVTNECTQDFKLVKDQNVVFEVENKKKQSEPTKIKIRSNENQNSGDPLYIIDGVQVQKNISNNLDPKDIKSISVFKKEKDIAMYGEKGKNGVIVITTKNGDFKTEDVVVEGQELTLPTPKPLIIVDGVEKTEEELENISPDRIATINVYKGDDSIIEYGEKGKNGVIVVVTKKKKENIIVLHVVDGIEKDSEEIENLEATLKTYTLTPPMAKAKANIDTDADMVDFIFTKENQDLEKEMPLQVRLLENPVVDGSVDFEYNSDNLKAINVSILSLVGQRLKTEKISPNHKIGRLSIDLNGIPSGMYLLSLESDDVRVVQQFIISN